MREHLRFYINGQWVDPISTSTHEVIDPDTAQPVARIALGNAQDVERAVQAAVRSFDSYSRTSVEERIALLERIIAIYDRRREEMVDAITTEMGSPLWQSRMYQTHSGMVHFTETLTALQTFRFEEMIGDARVVREPVGVCGLITPWNWPQNQISCKIAPALATGCTMVLKPSELAPLDAILLAEILHEAGVPAGVFNLVNGTGPEVGQAIAGHPGVDMVSFTGSNRGGVAVSKTAADTVKRVALELGGKSANILLDDVDLEKAVEENVTVITINAGQNCNAPSRMLVPRPLYDRAVALAASLAEKAKIRPPREDEEGSMGPLANAGQFAKVQSMIQQGLDEGARLVAGGLGHPQGLDRGYYVRPTVFADVRPSMRIWREEIFGPVLSIMPYDTEDEAVALANDTIYGLSGYVQSASQDRARAVARRMRTGMVHLNGAHEEPKAAFGGYKQSGNGREFGAFGMHEFLEVKSVFGCGLN